jgi:PAS domain S-box-containing protein
LSPEKELRNSEENFNVLFDENPIPTLLSEMPSGKIAFANKRMAVLMDRNIDDIVGKTANELGLLQNPSDQDRLTAVIGAKGYVDNIEVAKLFPDGSHGTDLISMRLVTMNGKPHCLTVVQDITGRKQAEEALRKSEERYRRLVETTDTAYVIIDNKGIVLDANQEYVRLSGHETLDEILGRSVLEWTADEEKEANTQAIAACLRNGTIRNLELAYVDKRGTRTPLEINATVMETGGTMRILSLCRDITERRRTDVQRKTAIGALRIRESYLSAIIENQPGLLWMKDRDGKFLAVNTKFSISCGLGDPQLLVGKTDFDIWPHDLAAGYLADDNKVMQSKEPCMVEEPISDKGEIRWFETFKAPIMDKQGIVIGTTGYSRDITERKRMEEELQKSQKLDSLGVLAGGIAHDFNNLLGGIFGHIDLARYVSRDATVREYLDAVMNTMDRARSLTQQLLTFAKGGEPTRKTESLVPFIQETALFALSGSSISSTFDFQKDLWSSSFDRSQIGQVIDNIIINAQQAMPLGGSIEISARNLVLQEKTHPVLAKGNYIRISVKDHGVGIPKEILPRIFDPFFTTKTKGHGLGLATCHSIVTRHNGAIDVESEPGKGSTFHLFLPAMPGSSLSAPENQPSWHAGSGTIIIMDDEKVMRDTIGQMLTSLGYSPEYANNGKEAFDLLVAATREQRRVAGVFLDLTIPGSVGGKEAAAQIRKMDSKIPLFVSSGYADDPVMADPGKYGFTASICKPFKLSDLIEMLNRYLKTV